MANTISVELVQIKQKSAGRSFEISHAERILKVRNTSWELPKNSPYKLTANGLIKKPSKGNTGKPSK